MADDRDPERRDPPVLKQGHGTGRERELGRRRFVELTAAAVPGVMLSACADDDPMSGGTGSSSSGEDTSTGPLDDSGSAGPTTDAEGSGSTALDSDSGDSDESETGTEPVDFDPEAIPESLELFPRTVLAGDMDTDSVTLAVYVADAAPKRLRVWQPVEGDRVDLLHDYDVTPDADGFVKERVEGLPDGQWVRYAFFEVQDDALVSRSLIGNVRTALAPGRAEPITIAFGSCVGRGTLIPDYVDPDDIEPFEWDIADMAADLEFDLFVHLGDQGYMDQVWSAGGTYESYLAAWGAYHGGGFRQIYPKAGMLSCPDDHEVVDNGTVDPWTDDPFDRERIDNGMDAYYTVMPIDGLDPEATPLWRSVRFGDTVEVVMLDTRYERQPEPELRFISEEQMEFLLDRIANSPCRFVCVATPKPYAHVRMLASDYPGGGERWQGHVADRQQVRDLVDAQDIRNVIWVTGDIHMCYLGQTDEEDPSPSGQMWEVCCTSGNINPLALLLSPDQFEWYTDQPHMPVLTFDPELGEILVQFYDSDGGISHERTIYVPV